MDFGEILVGSPSIWFHVWALKVWSNLDHGNPHKIHNQKYHPKSTIYAMLLSLWPYFGSYELQTKFCPESSNRVQIIGAPPRLQTAHKLSIGSLASNQCLDKYVAGSNWKRFWFVVSVYSIGCVLWMRGTCGHETYMVRFSAKSCISYQKWQGGTHVKLACDGSWTI